MPNCSESLGSGRAARCAVCDGKFGLVRHYSWRSQHCSKKCVDRFRARRASDRNWLPWLQIAWGARCAASPELLFLRYRLQSFKVAGGILGQYGLVVVIS